MSSSCATPVMKKRKGSNWTEEETRVFLELCIEKNIMKLMDGKRHKHIGIYKLLEKAMQEKGFMKTASQMQIKMKHLKELYYKCIRNNGHSGADRADFCYFEMMDQLLNARPKTIAMAHEDNQGIDSSQPLDHHDETQLSEYEGETEAGEVIIIDTEEAPEESEASYDSPTPSCSKRKTHTSSSGKGNKGGRTSYAKSMSEFTHFIVTQQSQAMKEMWTEQNNSWMEHMSAQCELQRKWEQEVMQREHEFQARMMQSLMETFMQGLQGLQQTHAPVSVCHMPSTSRPVFVPFSNPETTSKSDDNDTVNKGT